MPLKFYKYSGWFNAPLHQVVEDPDLCGDGEVEVDEVDVVGARLEDVGLLRRRFLVPVVEPAKQQLRILDDDQRFHDRRLEELLHEPLLDLDKNVLQ